MLPPPAPLRIAFVPGVTPGRWLRTWEQRVRGVPLEATQVPDADQLSVLYDGRADMCFVRLPVDRDDLSVIPLYLEDPVVVVAKEHPVAAYDEVAVTDLADEHLLQDPDTVPEWRDVAAEVRDGTRADVPDWTAEEAIAVVATDAGIVVVPKSVAWLHQRKDVASRPVTGVAGSRVGLAWLTRATDERIETFIGIVRGRTERSSRAGDAPAPERKPAAKQQRPKPARQAQRSRTAGKRTPRSGGGRRGRR